MKKILFSFILLIMLFTLTACDEFIETKEIKVNATVISVEEKTVFDDYETKTVKKNGKTEKVQVKDYDDVLELVIEYNHNGKKYTDTKQLDFDDDIDLIEDYYSDYDEGNDIPAVLIEDVYKEEETGELYSKFSLRFDIQEIEK